MASAVLVDSGSLESAWLGRHKAAFDRYLQQQTEQDEDNHDGQRPSEKPVLSHRRSSRIMSHDQDSPELAKVGEEHSTGRVSSSEPKAERSSERRTRAKKGSMRDYSSNSDEEYSGTRRRRDRTEPKYRKSLQDFHFERPDPVTAAKNKAHRERQRRERLNDSFADLVKTLDPEGSIRGEKTSIIATTIRSINSLRKENAKLKQEKDEVRHQLALIEKEKRDTEFQRAMVERQLEDLRLNVYGPQGMQRSIGGGLEPAGQIDINTSPQLSPGGLSRILQEQANLREPVQQGSLDAQMFQQGVRGPGNAFMPMISSQPIDQPMSQQIPSFNPNTDYLEMLASDIAPDGPDGMSMSPILWLNEALGPEADESYMCSNL